MAACEKFHIIGLNPLLQYNDLQGHALKVKVFCVLLLENSLFKLDGFLN